MADSPKQVLLIDDDDRFSLDFKGLVSEQLPEFEIIRSRSLETALKAAHSRQPALALLSLTLNDHAPLDALRIWQGNQPPDLPFIVLLAAKDDTLIDVAREVGAQDWLLKDEHLPLLLDRTIRNAVAYNALKLSARRFRETVEGFFSSSGFAILRSEGERQQIVQVNPQATELYGYSEEEFSKLCIDDLLLTDHSGLDAQSLRWLGRAANAKGATREIHRADDGRICFVESSRFPMRLNGQPGFVTTVNDLSNYKLAEDEVRFLQEFNSSLLDHLPFCITVMTQDRRITYQNETSSSTFGLLVGRTYDEAAQSRPELQPLADELAALDVNHGEGIVPFDGRIWSFQLQRFSDGRSDGGLIVELGRDVTDEIRVQQNLIDAQRMEAVGNLAGGVAHDFNNLLSGILGYANLIQAVSDENEQIVQYAQVIEETCLRASDLTRQLLQFARSKAHSQERFDVGTVARYAGKLLRHSVKKEIRVEHELSAKKLLILGDPAQVQQMIVNLALNANESMTDGTIVLRSDRIDVGDDHELIERGLTPGQYATVSVADTGRGLDNESTIQLFNPYFAGETRGEPLSLSLSVAKAIAKNHDGIIIATGEAKRGVTVTVYLPIARLESKPDVVEDIDSPVQGSETILIIDDEEVIRNLMLTSLSRYGYRVLVASGGEEGVNLYSMFKDEIDLVMLDLGLPGMDGRKVFKLIRALNPKAKVILFTGSQSTSRVKQLIEEGAASWISKPISLKRLSHTMRETLDNPSAPESKASKQD
jgi:PAS domain S-box-containing protein